MSKLFLPISALDLSISCIGLFIVLWGSVSFLAKERLFIGEAPIALFIGILLGPHCLGKALGWTQPGQPEFPGGSIDEMTLGLSRVVIGIQLVLVGVQLPPGILSKQFVSVAVLLIPVMFTSWILSTACIWLVVPGVPILVALIIASCTTATDPVLSNAIVKGAFADEYVSPSLRNLISSESGANDGFGYPFLFLAVHLLKAPTTSGALKTWLLDTILYQVVGSAIYGALIGFLGLKALRFSSDKNWIDKESFLLWAVGLGLFTIGTGGMLGIDDLLSAFIAGNFLTWDDFYREETESDEIQNCLDLLLNVVFFLYVGYSIPFNAFNQPEYGITPARLFLLGILVLIFRRLPALLLHYKFIPAVKDVREAAFMGYMGPIGAGTVFYLALVLEEFEKEDGIAEHDLIKILVKPICYALILSSIVGHSLMIPFVKLAFVTLGVDRIRSSETDDTDDEGEDGKEEFEEDSVVYQDEEEDDYRDGHPRIGSPANDRTTSFHKTNTPSVHSDHLSKPSPKRRSTLGTDSSARYSSATGHGEADESGLESSHSDDQHRHERGRTSSRDPSWRHSSGHKLGPHAIHVHRHSTVLRHGGSEDGEEVILPGGWGGERRPSAAGGSTIKGSRSQAQEDSPLLSVNQGSNAASGSGSKQKYGTLEEHVPGPLQKVVLKAKKQAKQKAKAEGEDPEEIREEEHREG